MVSSILPKNAMKKLDLTYKSSILKNLISNQHKKGSLDNTISSVLLSVHPISKKKYS